MDFENLFQHFIFKLDPDQGAVSSNSTAKRNQQVLKLLLACHLQPEFISILCQQTVQEENLRLAKNLLVFGPIQQIILAWNLMVMLVDFLIFDQDLIVVTASLFQAD